MQLFLGCPLSPEEQALDDAVKTVRRAIGLTAAFGAEGGKINLVQCWQCGVRLEDDTVGVRVEVGDDWAFVSFAAFVGAQSPADVRGVLAAALPAHADIILARRSPSELLPAENASGAGQDLYGVEPVYNPPTPRG
jgi:hypothetical protein